MPKSKKKIPKYREYEGEDYHDEEPYDREDDEKKQTKISANDKKKYNNVVNNKFNILKEKAIMTQKYDGILTCMIETTTRSTTVVGDDSDYASTGKNASVGKLVWTQTRGAMKQNDVVTHLCKNASCYNPWHLHAEPKGINIDRRYCKGYCRNPTSSDLLIVCKHNPKCLNITEFAELEDELEGEDEELEDEDEELEEGSTKIDVEKYQTIDPSKIDPTPKRKSKIWIKKDKKRKK